MYALSLEWERCPDGVELIDHGPAKKVGLPGRATVLTPDIELGGHCRRPCKATDYH